MTSDDPDMTWLLTAFDKTEQVHSKLPISKEQLVALRRWVPSMPDDPWYVHSYRVAPGALSGVAHVLGCAPLDPDLEYFVDGYAAS